MNRASSKMLIFLVLNVVVLNGCASYSGVDRKGKFVYLTGSTTFLMFSSHWVKKCVEKTSRLECKELDVVAAKSNIDFSKKSTTHAGNDREKELRTTRATKWPSLQRTTGVKQWNFPPLGDFPIEVEQRLKKNRQLLVGCRNVYNKSIRKITLRVAIEKDGSIGYFGIDNIDSSSQFYSCISKIFRSLPFEESKLDKRLYSKDLVF